MKNVNKIIELFGGLTAMSRALGHKHPTTVQGWKESNRIPSWREHEINAAAKKLKIKLKDLA